MTQTNNLKLQVINSQIDKATTEISDTAEEVSYMGYPAQKTIRVSFPEGIQSITLNNKTIKINVTTAELNYEYTKETTPTITGTIETYKGPHILKIKAENNYINITETT